MSGFYKEHDGTYQDKKLEIKVMCLNTVSEEKVAEATINIAKYVDKGVVRDNIQLNGNAYYLDFEISVMFAATRPSVMMSEVNQADLLRSSEKGDYRSKSSTSTDIKEF